MYNDVTYRRLEKTLTLLRDEKQPVAAGFLCRTLLGEAPLRLPAAMRAVRGG
jgi:hypothetical protein